MGDIATFYGQPGLHVEVYDSLFGTTEDVAFYRSLAEEAGERVLELGVGTGRVAIPLAEAGLDVVGIDRSAAMLAVADRQRAALPAGVGARLRLVQGDIVDLAALEPDAEFDLVFAAFRVFMGVLEPGAQRQCLDAVRRHLRPGGILAIDLFDPLLDRVVPGPQPPGERGEVRHPSSGRVVRVTAVERVADPLRQLLHERWRFREIDDAGALVREELEDLWLRWTYRHEMRYLLELTGFEPLAEYSDYDRSAPAYGREQVWVAHRR